MSGPLWEVRVTLDGTGQDRGNFFFGINGKGVLKARL